jgi:UDP-2,4-diacetamido-2,4,6-trideoxy-beta-L-altropyranose hydrolase
MGAGHVMRCIALAQAWKARGGLVHFISRCESTSLRKRIDAEGFGLVPLQAGHSDSVDIEETCRIISRKGSGEQDWLVLDGYHFDSQYYRAANQAGVKVMVVDDNHHLPFYQADAVLNPNIYGDDIRYRCHPKTLLFLGGEYALIRSEFLRLRSSRKDFHVAEKAKRIVVILGGGDSKNVTEIVLKALSLLPNNSFEVRVVVGPANLNMESLSAAATDCTFDVELVFNTEDMPSLLSWADMAITAAGGTCLELAFLGVPAITIITADNQERVAASFYRDDIFKTVGWWNDFSVSHLSDKIRKLSENKFSRQQMSDRGRRRIVGDGAEKCVVALLGNNKFKTLNSVIAL